MSRDDDVADSTRRMREFRDRLASQNLRRWEIYISDETKAQVRDIARREGTSAGIAAEALLALGVAAYEAGAAPRPSSSSAAPEPSALVAYSRRVALGDPAGPATPAAPRPAAAAGMATRSPMQSFVDKVKARQAGRGKKDGDPGPGTAGR